MIVGPLYHWSPADRFTAIRENGLRPSQEPTVASGPLHYICVSTSPIAAWTLSAATDWCQEIESWDLWIIHCAPSDELHVRPFFGNQMEEIKIRNPIGPDRIWWVGRRDISCVPATALAKGSVTS